MIFVTGATGLLGVHLVKNLVARGENVVALKRSTSDLSPLGANASKVKWIEGDVNDVSSLEEAMQGAERVFHCAALISFRKKDVPNLYKTNVEGTANVMNVALASGVKKLVHISSVAAFGFQPKGEIISEKTIYAEREGVTDYFRSKHYGEREAWRAYAEGLNVVIANPSTILGGGWFHSDPNIIFSQVKKGLSFYTNGSNGFVDVRDAAKALEILMDKAEAGTQYIINAANLEFKNLLYQIADELGKKRPSFYLSPTWAKVAIAYSAAHSLFTNKAPLLTPQKYLVASTDFKYSGMLFKTHFSFDFRPLQQTIKDSCAALNNGLKADKQFAILQ